MGLIREAVGYESKHVKAVEKADGGQLGISLWFLKHLKSIRTCEFDAQLSRYNCKRNKIASANAACFTIDRVGSLRKEMNELHSNDFASDTYHPVQDLKTKLRREYWA